MSELSNNGSCILIYDEIETLDYVYKFFRENGFWATEHSRGIFFPCVYLYVNPFKKVYAFGMPRISFARSFYEHAITVNEFIIIYNIYEKYRGASTFRNVEINNKVSIITNNKQKAYGITR